MTEIEKLENEYSKILLKKGIDYYSLSPDKALSLLGISFNSEWYQDMNFWDYLVAFFSGVLGAVVINLGKNADGNFTLNSKDSYLSGKLNVIHNKFSKITYDPEKNFLNNIFAHGGDNIDKIPDIVYLENIPLKMHRLFSGHDLFQFSKDNVLLTMFNQFGIEGLLRGIVHFFYDSCSSMGLPLPGTSNFAEIIYKDWCKRSTDIYQKFFTLKTTDFLSGGVTYAMLNAYRFLDSKYWTRRNHSKDLQLFNKINIVAYSVNCAVNLMCGKLNPVVAAIIVKNSFQYQLKSWNRTKDVCAKVDELSSMILSMPIDNRTVEHRVTDIESEFQKFIKE